MKDLMDAYGDAAIGTIGALVLMGLVMAVFFGGGFGEFLLSFFRGAV